MKKKCKYSRRTFIKGAVGAGAAAAVGNLANPSETEAVTAGKSEVFEAYKCPVHDEQDRHSGLDVLFFLMATQDLNLYQTTTSTAWGSSTGIIASDDIVVIKVNAQWKARGTTNTDLLRGLIYRILQHPDGFTGEIVIYGNGQGWGSFDGNPTAVNYYEGTPIENSVIVNAEDQSTTTVDYLVNTVFASDPVSSYLADSTIANFITDSDHTSNGFRRIAADLISYPCFTTSAGNRVEFKEGIWNGSSYDSKLKFINVPMLKHHDSAQWFGMSGALKHCYGLLSMSDGYGGDFSADDIRHFGELGSQCGKMYTSVRAPDLTILDCIWISFASQEGYPDNTVSRENKIVAGVDPVAIDYWASKNLLYPLGGDYAAYHNPDDTASELYSHLVLARDTINNAGGIAGDSARIGDANIAHYSINAQSIPAISALGAAALAAGMAIAGGDKIEKKKT